MPMSPADRSLHARLAAHSLSARITDPAAHTAHARAAFMSRWERGVNPDGVLMPEDPACRAERAKQAYCLRLALRSPQSRRAKAGCG